MIYHFLKILFRLQFWCFVRQLRIENPERRGEKGPLLLAVNHPNSLLDALIVGGFMDEPIHFMARGDVFRLKPVRKFLEKLNMIPIYRIRDGKAKLSMNDRSFDKGVEVLKNNGLLLIFVEGFCANQTELQLPLKKGGPRMVQSSWRHNIPARILPVWLEYSGFRSFGLSVNVRFGEPFGNEIATNVDSTRTLNEINKETTVRLQKLHGGRKITLNRIPGFLKVLLFIPALAGLLIHWPVYTLGAVIANHINKKKVHYHSILFTLLMFVLPFFWLLCGGIMFIFTQSWLFAVATILALPFLLKLSHFIRR